jgi:pilus assembly protein CpaF
MYSTSSSSPHANRPSEGGFSRQMGGDLNKLRAIVPSVTQREQSFYEIQRRIQTQLATRLESSKIDLTQMDVPHQRKVVEEHLQSLVESEVAKAGISLTRTDRQRLYDSCLAEIIGLGPIDSLLQDDSITEIMVNNAQDIWVEQNGKKVKTAIRFRDNEHVLRVIERIVARVGRRIDDTSPMVDARLPEDGSRVNAIIPPVALDGPKLTIRKFARHRFSPQDLVDKGSIPSDILDFVAACVRTRRNIIVSGGTNSGKSTLLGILSCFIPERERIITIEDSAELQLQQEHVVRLESRPASIEGKNRITIRDLLINTLRMTPDRIIIGECRGGEALDMLQAMNTGHEGSMTTVHANNSRQVISRLETLALQSDVELPSRAIREQIASAIHLIVHTDHFHDGTRRVVSVSEVTRNAGERVDVIDIFSFERTRIDGRWAYCRLFAMDRRNTTRP